MTEEDRGLWSTHAELGLIGEREGSPLAWMQSVWGRLSPEDKSRGSTLMLEWRERWDDEDSARFTYCFGRDAADPDEAIPEGAGFHLLLDIQGSWGEQRLSGFISATLKGGAFLEASVHCPGQKIYETWLAGLAGRFVEWFFDSRVEFLTFGVEDDLGTYANPGIFCVYPETKQIPGGGSSLAALGLATARYADALVVWAQTPRAFLDGIWWSPDVLRRMDLLRETSP